MIAATINTAAAAKVKTQRKYQQCLICRAALRLKRCRKSAGHSLCTKAYRALKHRLEAVFLHSTSPTEELAFSNNHRDFLRK